jgi:hypothetical protein
MDGYLTKPLELGKLQDIVGELSEQSTSRHVISNATRECGSVNEDSEKKRLVV